jgi:endonuclease/exonuclease/phosphatase (EEP) superfamily protein YafD
MSIIILCTILCLRDILPFTTLYPKEIKTCKLKELSKNLSILTFNVYQKNNQYQAMMDLVHTLDPDMVLLLETNEDWRKEIKPLDRIYPYQIKAIQENTYGMMLLSKLAPIEENIERLTDNKIPSIDCLVNFNNRKIRLRGLHPRPPVPGEALTSKQKDAEFREAAKVISELPSDEIVIVAGDLNDVVWSKASKRFKKTSNLKDPRVGRGTFSTFPTYLPIRFPLDHIFCSSELQVCELSVLGNIGSDHFPIYVVFYVP